MYTRRVVRPPSYVHARAYVYAIAGVHQDTFGPEPFLYIGQTVRDPYVRLAEHREDKLWSGWITGVQVLWTGTCTQAQLDDLEREAIERFRPLYNIDMNMRNDRRVKPWEVKPRRAVRTQGSGSVALGAPALTFFLTMLVTMVMFAALISMYS
jgi:hypothetical protein